MIFEVCIDSYEGALLAKKYAAKRVELCSALSVGGLNPSIALTKKCSTLSDLEVHVMIRHTEGGFVYSDSAIQIMKEDIRQFASAGAKGVVFGCLTTDYKINLSQNKELVEIAKQMDLECTFNRAFDFVKDPKKELKSIISLGFDRLLTSGQEKTAIEGIDCINELVKQAKQGIQIMAGSGVNASNALALSNIGIDALHFTSHIKNSEGDSLGMGIANKPDEHKIAAITKLFS